MPGAAHWFARGGDDPGEIGRNASHGGHEGHGAPEPLRGLRAFYPTSQNPHPGVERGPDDSYRSWERLVSRGRYAEATEQFSGSLCLRVTQQRSWSATEFADSVWPSRRLIPDCSGKFGIEVGRSHAESSESAETALVSFLMTLLTLRDPSSPPVPERSSATRYQNRRKCHAIRDHATVNAERLRRMSSAGGVRPAILRRGRQARQGRITA